MKSVVLEWIGGSMKLEHGTAFNVLIFLRRKLPHAEQRGQVPIMLLTGLRLYNLFINTCSGSLVEF
jgi:hypothetical protein